MKSSRYTVFIRNRQTHDGRGITRRNGLYIDASFAATDQEQSFRSPIQQKSKVIFFSGIDPRCYVYLYIIINRHYRSLFLQFYKEFLETRFVWSSNNALSCVLRHPLPLPRHIRHELRFGIHYQRLLFLFLLIRLGP